MTTDPSSADVAAILPEPIEAQPDAAAYDPPGGVPDEHPEYLVGGAFVGAFLLAKLLKRLGS
jgi:hypothetical protein